MNRSEYQSARRMIRDNGFSAIQWLDPESAAAMTRVYVIAPHDPLAYRAEGVAMGYRGMEGGVHNQQRFTRS